MELMRWGTKSHLAMAAQKITTDNLLQLTPFFSPLLRLLRTGDDIIIILVYCLSILGFGRNMAAAMEGDLLSSTYRVLILCK